MRRHPGRDRAHKILARHLRQRHQLDVPDRDGVEGDVDASGACGHGIRVFIDRPLVEGIDSHGLCRSSRGADLLGHPVEALWGSTGEEHFSALAGEGAGHRAADRASPAVDHGILVFKQHYILPFVWFISKFPRTWIHLSGPGVCSITRQHLSAFFNRSRLRR
jgi:hypothetical protein